MKEQEVHGIQPLIFFDKNECPICRGKVKLITGDLIISDLTAGGYPINSEVVRSTAVAYCPTCKVKFNVKYNENSLSYQPILSNKNITERCESKVLIDNPFSRKD